MPNGRVSLSLSGGAMTEVQRHVGFALASMAAAFVLGALFTGGGAVIDILTHRHSS